MKKWYISFIICLTFGVLLITASLLLSNNIEKNKENNNSEINDKENSNNDSNTEDKFIKIVKNAFENSNKDESYSDKYPSFYVNSVHAGAPGGFGDTMPDTYYFNSDGTYLWTLSEYKVLEEKVASAGKFEIKDNVLTLIELYTLTKEDGKIIEGVMPGGETGNILADYKYQVNVSNNTYTYTIKNEGLSSYKSQMNPDDTRPDSYSLTINEKTENWFSLGHNSYEYEANWLNEYYEMIK